MLCLSNGNPAKLDTTAMSQGLRDGKLVNARTVPRTVPAGQARLAETNAKLRELQKAAKGLAQLQRLKAAADETCTRLRAEVLPYCLVRWLLPAPFASYAKTS